MKFYKLTEADLPLIFEMNESELKVYCWLNVHLPFGDSKAIEIDTAQLAEEIGISRRSVQRALQSLAENAWIDPSACGLKPHSQERIEFQIRERLKSQLGGLSEVKTPAGRIDLLTETEIIEVKRIGEWKSALGQILVYSGFYPEHKRRLHLFGRESDQKQIATIANSCLAFDVSVSFEMVGVEA